MDYSTVLGIFYTGLSLSFTSSFLVLYVLLKLKYKDISTHLRLYSAIIDILSTFGILFCILNYSESGFCVLNFIYIYSTVSHECWIFYMSLTMYQIICLKKEMNSKAVFITFLITSLISLIVISPYLFLLESNTCYDIFITDFHITYFGCVVVAPEIIIIFIIGYFYYKIRKSMMKEVGELNRLNKNLFNRLFGYVLLFSLLFTDNLLTTIKFTFGENVDPIDYMRLVIYSFYSFFDSLLYGFTRSFLRTIKFEFKRNQTFVEQEELLNELRSERLIFPRYYYDIMSQSEEIALH
jgi:hypothetical protein